MKARFPGRLLLLGVLAVAAALFAINLLVMRLELRASVGTLSELVDNALPGLKELIEARRELRVLHEDVKAAVVAAGTERESLERHAGTLWVSIQRHVSAYESTPVFPGEGPLQVELGRALVRLRESIDAALAARDVESAQRVFRVDVDPAADAAFDALVALTEFNIAEARKAADAIGRRHDRAMTMALGLFVAFAAAIVLVGTVVFRYLARAEREVAARMAELDAFASRVAHDLRGPLSPVRMALALAAREGTPPATIRDAARTADRSVERMVALMDGLLAFARAGARVEPGARASVDEVVREVATDVAPLREAERAGLALEVEPGLVVRASRGALLSIVGNLLRNALIHLGDSEERRVTLRARREGTRAVIEVADTGPGIAPELASRLFQPFARGSSRPDGHGLGLATVKRLVDGHQGALSVASTDEGCTFRVELPAA